MTIPFNLTIIPSTRRTTPGAHPGRAFVAKNGAETPILFGDRMTGARISAGWPAIPDSEAQKALAAWEASYSGALDVEFPPGLLAGIEADTGQGLPSYLSWTIAEEPVVESVRKGYSSLSLVMRGRLS